MNYQVSIYDNEMRELIKFHETNILRIDKLFEDLRAERAKSVRRIEELSAPRQIDHAMPLFSIGQYSPDMTLVKKTELILNAEKIVMTTRGIAMQIIKLHYPFTMAGHPELDVKDVVSSLGATLKQKVDKHDTFSRVEVNGVLYYGLVGWFNADGTLKDEYSRMSMYGVLDMDEMNKPLEFGGRSGLNDFE